MSWLFSIPIFPVKNTSAHSDLNQRYSTYVPAVLLLPGSFCRKHERSLQYTHISHTYSPQMQSLYFMTQNKETEKNIKWPLNTFFFLIRDLQTYYFILTADCALILNWHVLGQAHLSLLNTPFSWQNVQTEITAHEKCNINSLWKQYFFSRVQFFIFSELFAIGAIFLYALRRTNVYFPADNRRRQLSGHKLRS